LLKRPGGERTAKEATSSGRIDKIRGDRRARGNIMGRNSELIRQWTILQKIATARGQTIPKLATDLSVSTRTIRRDLVALQAAGFPVYDEDVHGAKFWRLDARAMGALARTGVTLSELAALYFSRALIECFAGTALRKDITSVFDKLEAVLSPAMKKFLDRLPRVISAKHEHAKRQGAHTYEVTARLLHAILGQRVVSMQYHSLESRRQKLYAVHPSRLIHAQGGLYLIAFVPAYAEVRTFAVERISKASVQETTFEPIAELDSDPFKNSLGVHRGGQTCKVRLRFHPQIVPFVKERTWHVSQQLDDRSDGSMDMTLDVTDDYALRNWILGFGRLVKVLKPAQLVKWTEDELDAARQQYESGSVAVDSDVQPPLPFLLTRLVSA
jgi:predicted DNA-binding transcriptional regulator YafY